MKYEDNDTLNANGQQTTDGNVKKTNDGTKKIVAGMATGAVLGSAATYGAEVLLDKEEEQPVVADTEDNAEAPVETTEEETATVEQPKPAKTVPAKEEQHEAHHTTINEHSQNLHNAANAESTFMKENEIEIDKIETTEMQGHSVHMASGSVNGHAAAIFDDGQGNVVAAAVDQNDNGQLDDGEMVDLRGQNITMGDVAGRLSTEPSTDVNVTPASQNHEVHVVAVQHDVDIDGQTVDVAAVTIDESPVLFIDADQNGEADVALFDANQNGTLEDDDLVDVRERHITMPTRADMMDSTMAAAGDDGMPDYSNDADTTLYEV